MIDVPAILLAASPGAGSFRRTLVIARVSGLVWHSSVAQDRGISQPNFTGCKRSKPPVSHPYTTTLL